MLLRVIYIYNTCEVFLKYVKYVLYSNKTYIVTLYMLYTYCSCIHVRITKQDHQLSITLLMEEILHHLGCKKTLYILVSSTYQLVHDFFHQQHHQASIL